VNPRGNCQVTNCNKRRVEVVLIGARFYCLACAAPLLGKDSRQLELPFTKPKEGAE